ncbi:MAG TPA: glycoside hydrolase family 76 protein, partial [Bacillota bacterium]|nr:glycoside hydrolase family 76 protein [Bacillota bacterium]
TMAHWLHDVLVDPVTGLVRDGIHTDGTLVERTYTYGQGVVLGLEVELAHRTGDRLHVDRVATLVAAVAGRLCEGGVVTDGGGGDGGLFNGILLRHLAVVAGELPGRDATATQARATARRVVLASADAAWHHRWRRSDGPVFGHLWTRPAPAPSPLVPERDLSVQLSGWMAMEAAARLH